jgi:hypothetical protein
VFRTAFGGMLRLERRAHVMRRPANYVLMVAALATWTLAASTVSAAPRGFSPFQLRDQFGQCGYEVGNKGVPSTTPYVVIRDPGAMEARAADYRIVMAIVFTTPEAANAAHQKAHTQAEARLGEQHPFSNDFGPQLLVGYGGSVWRSNVALVESTSRTLASLYSYDDQMGEARIARPELFELGFSPKLNEYAVDRDVVGCLEGGLLADDSSQGAGVVEPIFMRGRPW